MSCNSIVVKNISKSYPIFEKPIHRLFQMFFLGHKKLYSEVNVLRNISFELKKGETIGIIGKNGAGKSTLLQILCGTLSQTSGEVEVQGKVAALLELGAGFNPEFTGIENIKLSASLYGLTSKEIDEKLESIIAFSEINDYVYKPVKTYSSGMFLRLAFSVIAHVDADILIIDEALAVGDVYFTQKCMRFINEFKKNGTVLFVSHDTNSITTLCDRAIWLNNGSIELIDTAKIVSEAYLEDYFGSTQELIENEFISSAENISSNVEYIDVREQFINQTNSRNDIEIFEFVDDGSFGSKKAIIKNVSLTHSNKNIVWCVGGEIVKLKIEINAKKEVKNLISGFYFKNRHGQTIFGDNTYITTQQKKMNLDLNENESLSICFEFRLPVLPAGDYTINVAVASGTQNNHEQLHWIHDAIALTSHTTSVASGLVGIPMKDITFTQI